MEKNLDRLVDDREELLERILNDYAKLNVEERAIIDSLVDALIEGQSVLQ